jgi:RNA polymerase sigma factor (sigma-70 family)
MLPTAFLAVENTVADDEGDVQQLVEQARSGDSQAGRDLYRLFATRVFRAVRPLCASEADAEDLVQDTFIKAFGSLRRYHARPGVRFVAWLMTIALNTARKRARRLGRTAVLEPERIDALREADRGSPATAPDEDEDQRRLRTALIAALAEIPERDRLIVTLRYGADLDAAEVGSICHVTAENVRKICERQRQRLLARLSATPASSLARESKP